MNPLVEFDSMGTQIARSLDDDFTSDRYPSVFQTSSAFMPAKPGDDDIVYSTTTTEEYADGAPDLFGHKVGPVMARILQALETCPPSGLQNIFSLIYDTNVNMRVTEPFYILGSVGKRRVKSSSEKTDPPKPYRDHVLHPASMYLLGREFLLMNLGGASYEELLTKRVMSSRAGREALAFAKQTSRSLEQWKRIIRVAWTIASLSHDLGYAFDVGAYLHELQFNTRLMDPVRAAIADHHRRLVQSLRTKDIQNMMGPRAYRLFDESFTQPALAHVDGDKRLDHGQLLALLLLKAIFATEENRKLLRRPEEAMAMYLALRAIFYHDSWTKPGSMAPVKSKDDFSVFVCLMDLVAELRLIWNRVETKAMDNYQSRWKFDVWLPLRSIEFDPTATPPKLRFGKNADAKSYLFRKPGESKKPWLPRYDINLATGSSTGVGDDPSPSIGAKKDQYVRLLKRLGICEDLFVDIN